MTTLALKTGFNYFTHDQLGTFVEVSDFSDLVLLAVLLQFCLFFLGYFTAFNLAASMGSC